MKTTRELLAQLKTPKQAPAICKYCRQIFTFAKVGFTSRSSALENIEEIGIKCPGCKHFFHSYFISSTLEQARPPAKAPRKERRQFGRRFEKFQKQTRGWLKMRKVKGEWLHALKQ